MPAKARRARIRLFALPNGAGHMELHVQDDGPGITAGRARPPVRAVLYDVQSKGTGLGLYLARELCLNNQAMLDYEYRLDDRRDDAAGVRRATGRFVITFAAPDNVIRCTDVDYSVTERAAMSSPRSSPRILIVDDEDDLRELLETHPDQDGPGRRQRRPPWLAARAFYAKPASTRWC